jgi:DNA-binding response OmpR family regulator
MFLAQHPEGIAKSVSWIADLSDHLSNEAFCKEGRPMKRKVLIADDEEGVRQLLRIHLAKLGYEVREAADGEQAIGELEKDDFDLLICDILMPKKGGWEVIREVRSNSKTKQLPVIVLKAKDDPTDMFKGYDLGANYYMTKPFTKAELLYGLRLMFDGSPEQIRV